MFIFSHFSTFCSELKWTSLESYVMNLHSIDFNVKFGVVGSREAWWREHRVELLVCVVVSLINSLMVVFILTFFFLGGGHSDSIQPMIWLLNHFIHWLNKENSSNKKPRVPLNIILPIVLAWCTTKAKQGWAWPEPGWKTTRGKLGSGISEASRGRSPCGS